MPRCPICKSRKWHRDHVSELIVCSEGHVLENYRTETDEQGEFNTAYGVKKRTLKSQRVKKEYVSQANVLHYRGERARYLYFQCLQLLFRRQVAILIKTWSLPPEFENICRDTWALHLCLLPSGPPAEPLNFDSNGDEPPLPRAQRRKQKQRAKDDEYESEEGQEDASESDDSEDELTSSEDEEDSHIAALMREASEDSDPAVDARPGAEQRQPGPPAALKRRPFDSLTGNLCVLMVSCWILRLPITYADFIELIESFDLPYLAPLHHLPISLSQHLSGELQNELRSHRVPNVRDLHGMSAQLARRLHANFQVVIPEYNAAPVLWRAVRALNGSPTLYTSAKRLAAQVDIELDLSYPQGRDKRRADHHPPETTLVGCVVLALKFMYGLDGKERRPKDLDDPLASMPLFSDWLATIKARHAQNERDILKGPSGKWADGEVLLEPSGMSPLDMTDEETDRFLAFCHKALVDPREGITSRDQDIKDDFFPLPPLPPASTSSKVPTTPFPPYSALPPTPLSSNSTTLRPGQDVVLYSFQDPSGVIHPDLSLVCAVAAYWARVDPDEVEFVVHVFERRVWRWWLGETAEREKEIRETLGTGRTLPEYLKPKYDD